MRSHLSSTSAGGALRLEAPSPTGCRTTPNASAPPVATADQGRKHEDPFRAIVLR